VQKETGQCSLAYIRYHPKTSTRIHTQQRGGKKGGRG
jgi:hypothetical protein